MYVPPLARSDAGFMRQEGSNNQGFASRKSSPTLLSMTRAAENGSSGTRTRNKGSNVTTGYEGIKKPTSSALIYPVKGNQTLDGYFEYMEEKALTSCKIVNKLVNLQYWTDCTSHKLIVSLVQKLSSITGYHRGKMTTPSARFRSL